MAQDHEPAIALLTRITRVGWLSKGLVFVLIGLIAIRIGMTRWPDEGPDATQAGALRVVSDQPFGAVLLVVVSAGLAVFTVWNVAQALIPASTDGGPLGIAKRVGWLGLGAFYGLTAFMGFTMAVGDASVREGGDPASGEASPTALTARLLAAPGGRVVALVVAAVALAVAGYHAHKGATRRFVDDLDTDELTAAERRRLGRLGIAGFIARGFVLAVVAYFLAKAAVQFDPDEAVGLDGALREFASVTSGRLLIVMVGVGLAIAGVYDMVTFRHQRLR